jgi:hypothetical protein
VRRGGGPVEEFHVMRWIGLLMLALLTAGCGAATEKADATARGTVTVDGKPLTGGTVLFTPTGEGQGGSGLIESDGTFELRTSASKSGIDPGEYDVVIMPTDDMLDAEDGVPIPPKYSDMENPVLRETVTKEGPNEFKF